jgi:phosphatidylglycerophosphatase A
MKTSFNFSEVWTNPAYFLAFGFGSGLLPIAPGTWGTLFAIPIYLLIRDLPFYVYCFVLFVLIVGGIWICEVTERALGEHDYSGIVWDEVCGYLLTMLIAPIGWLWVISGFLLFRLFDIWKPWPVGWVDQNVGGGMGVMVDDLVAGVYAWVTLQIIVVLFLHFLPFIGRVV